MSNTPANHTPRRLKENVLLGSVYICISATMFAVAGAAVKMALQDITPVQLVFWRNLMSMLIFGSFLLVFRPETFTDLKSEKIGLHVIRSMLSLLVLYLYFYAVSQIELANAVLLLSTSPVFVPLLALVFLRHTSPLSVWGGVLVAFIGVAIVIDPSLKYSFNFRNYGVLSGLLSGIFGGAATIVIWRMSNTEPPDRQMVYFTVSSLLLSIPLCLFTWEPLKISALAPILCLGVATTLAQFYLSKGCQVAPADKINTWNYLSIVIAAIAAYVGWNEALTWPTVIGIILVIIGATLASKSKKSSPSN